MTALHQIRRIAEVEFSHLLTDVQPFGSKLRVFIRDGSFVDVWVSEKVAARFGFHWERGHLDGTLYRYDNFPDASGKPWRRFPITSIMAPKIRSRLRPSPQISSLHSGPL